MQARRNLHNLPVMTLVLKFQGSFLSPSSSTPDNTQPHTHLSQSKNPDTSFLPHSQHVPLLWAHPGAPHSKCSSFRCPPMVLRQKKTTCMQSFYKFGHRDQTLLPILWNCDKSLGIKQHGDHRGYDVYCAEQTVIIH